MKKIYHLAILFVVSMTMFGTPRAQPVQAAGEAYSLRFYGHGIGQVDRVKIPIDPHVPADVGGDFTIEFWMKAASADNTSGACTPGGVNWINGNVIIDRDVYGDGDHGDYGISLYGGKIAFGAAQGSTSQTICSAASVADNAWHHIAVTRNQTSGAMQIFIDGAIDASGTGPTGDISYRNGRETSYPDSDPYLVFGAEKHDAGPSYPSYNGFLDEVRISNNVRYTAAFDRPIAPLPADANAVALYRFDEGPAGNCTGGIEDVLATSNGFCSFGGDAPSGPMYSTDVPPIYQPDLVITGYELVDPITEDPLVGNPEPNETFGIRVLVKNQGGTDPASVFYRSVFVDRNPMDPALFEITDPEGCLYNIAEEENDWGDYRKEQINSSIPPGVTDTETIVEIPGGLPAGRYQIWLYADPLCAVQDEVSEFNNSFGPIAVNVGFPDDFNKTTPANSSTGQSLSPTLSWESSTGATSYEYCYSSAPGSCTSWKSVGTNTSVTLSGLAPDHTYYWQARAVNQFGETEANGGAWWSFTTTDVSACTWSPYTQPGASSFTDVEMNWATWNWIERLRNAGITQGCGAGVYCPLDGVSRQHMAIFLLRGKYCGSGYIPPPVNGDSGFLDVDPAWVTAPWIKQLAADGVTQGCGNGNFCPQDVVTRQHMAIFLLRAMHGGTYSPPGLNGGGAGFADVDPAWVTAAWIKQLAEEGITQGCGGGNYCPLDAVSRQHMAIFLVRAFGLP